MPSVETKSVFELLAEIKEVAELAPADEAKALLIYCLKQLKISAAAYKQNAGD